MKMNRIFFLVASAIILSPAMTFAQSGNGYSITQSTIASGGGTSTDTTNNVYSITGTAGQPVAGSASTAAPYSVSSGFWQNALSPTAASVSIGGRILTADGRGIRNIFVVMTEGDGSTRTILTGPFGHYRFSGVSAGQTVVVSISSKRFEFTQPVRVIDVSEEMFNIDFTAGGSAKIDQ